MRRLALAVLSAAPLVLLVASLVDRPWSWLAAALAAASLPPAAMLLGLGAAPQRAAAAVIVAVWVLVATALGGVVLLAVWPPVRPGPLGLPWAAALALAGLALLPLLLVAAGYAATFRPPVSGADPAAE